MASILSAGTTSNTALNLSADTSGVLQLATNGTTTAVTIDTSQNVGIGTASPAAKLDVRGNILTTNAAIFGGNVSAPTADAAIYRAADNTLAFSTASTERMRIDSSGNVGIGTSSPSKRLDVFDSNASTTTTTGVLIRNFSATGNSRAGVLFANFDNSASAIWSPRTGDTSGLLVFGTKPHTGNTGETDITERMRINSSGQLLVGATTTVFTNDTTGGSFQGSQTGGGKPILEVTNTSTSSSADGCPAIIAAKGSATTNSNARFIQFSASSAAQPMGGIVGNGATNVQFASISDAREKTNIQPISGSLQKINDLKPVEFDWIADGSHVNAGFVAQDVQQVFPEFVVENMADEGQEQRYGLTGGMTGGIIAHLVKAIQELNAKVAELEAKLK